MFPAFNPAWIVSAVFLWQIISVSYARESKDASKIFQQYHTSVVTVITDRARGTGFSIDPREYPDKETGKTVRLVITAFHVVQGAQSVILLIYHNKKNSEGMWESDVCPANVYGLDITRDLAFLAIPCHICACTSLGTLPTRLSAVSTGESVIIIGDSAGRRFHSFIDGRLSDTNFTMSLKLDIYKNLKSDVKTTRVHGLTGSFNRGDSGSAVMNVAGKVMGMMSGSNGDLHFCITMDEILKAKEQILNTLTPRYVGCTAHESVLLGREYWGERSGKSIMEMNALASAMNAQYFAIAHEGAEAHAFTFHILWWEILLGNDHMKEDLSQCLCEANSFIDDDVPEHTEEGKVMCGCAGNFCRNKTNYHRRSGEDNDRRWAIYKTMNRKIENSGYYEPSKESLASMENIAGEINYWKKKTNILEEEMERLKSEHHFYYGVGIAVILCVGTSVVIWLYNRWQSTVRLLKEEKTVCEGLREQLSRQQEASRDVEVINLHTQETHEQTTS